MSGQTRSDDAEQTGSTVLAFENPDGAAQAATGSDDGLDVSVTQQPLSRSATTNPTGENSRIVPVQSPNTLLLAEFLAYNNTGASLYVMVFDSATVPANGQVPIVTAVAFATGDTVSGEVEDRGLPFKAGICLVLSTTPLTLTLAAATAGSLTIFYRDSASS